MKMIEQGIDQEELEMKLMRVRILVRLIKRFEALPTRSAREDNELDQYRDEINALEDLSDEEGWSHEFLEHCDY